VSLIKHGFIFISVALMLFGCGDEPEVEQTAEDVAVAFFDAVYNQNDIDKALALSTPNFAEELGKYITTKNAARRLFNMSFDSVQIDAALGDKNVRREFKRSGKLVILFTGYRQDKLYKEMKEIRLVKKGDNWLVDELLPDPDFY